MLKIDSARSRRVGIALVTLATFCFAILDASAKWLVQTLPVVEVVWLRFATHVVLMSVLMALLQAPTQGLAIWRVRDWRLHLLRSAMLACMTGLNFWALQYLQLAVTGAMQFSVPILIALLSSWWLHERLDGRRWLAVRRVRRLRRRLQCLRELLATEEQYVLRLRAFQVVSCFTCCGPCLMFHVLWSMLHVSRVVVNPLWFMCSGVLFLAQSHTRTRMCS